MSASITACDITIQPWPWPARHRLFTRQRKRRPFAGFGGEALHALAWLGALPPDQGPQPLLVGGPPSLDRLLQFRTQGINGWYLPCADDAGTKVIDALNACDEELERR